MRRTALLYVHQALLKSGSPAAELARFEARARGAGWTVVETIVDQALGSYPLSRSAVKGLFDAVKHEPVQTVVIPSMRHFGGGSNSVLGVIAQIRESGGHVVSLAASELLDTTRPGAPDFQGWWRWHCHAEELLHGAKRREGIRRSAVAGRHGGRGGSEAQFPDTERIGQMVYQEMVPQVRLARQLGKTAWYVRQRCRDYLRDHPEIDASGRQRAC